MYSSGIHSTVAYDLAGNQLWVRTGDALLRDLVVDDRSGNVTVTGQAYEGDDQVVETSAYGSDGTDRWRATYGGVDPAVPGAYPGGLAVDPRTGTVYLQSPQGNGVAVVGYALTGAVIFSTVFADPQFALFTASAAAIEVDPARGRLYLGVTQITSTSPTRSAATTVAYRI